MYVPGVKTCSDSLLAYPDAPPPPPPITVTLNLFTPAGGEKVHESAVCEPGAGL